jgi:hypothetical protein
VRVGVCARASGGAADYDKRAMRYLTPVVVPIVLLLCLHSLLFRLGNTTRCTRWMHRVNATCIMDLERGSAGVLAATIRSPRRRFRPGGPQR